MTRAHRQSGFSMIEVLVALLVLAIGLLGLAMLQGQGLKFNTHAYTRTQATTLAYDILDRMRANPSGVGNGFYDVPSQSAAQAAIDAFAACKTGACDCTQSVCDSANLAKYDLGLWYEMQGTLLPQAAGNLSTVERSGTQVTVTIRWHENGVVKSQQWIAEL